MKYKAWVSGYPNIAKELLVKAHHAGCLMPDGAHINEWEHEKALWAIGGILVDLKNDDRVLTILNTDERKKYDAEKHFTETTAGDLIAFLVSSQNRCNSGA